jgi:ABC-type branched-subunit amino acid transport system substrate-binding protein
MSARIAKFVLGAGAGISALLACTHASIAKIGSCTEPVTFGTTISATGPFSVNADRWVRMTEIFAEEINQRGGVKLSGCDGKSVPLKFVIYDDQSTPATAVSLHEKLVTVDNVDVLVGPDWTPIGFPVSPIPDKHKVPTVLGNVSALQIFQRGFKYIFGAPTPSVFVWSHRYFDILAKQPNPPKSIFFAIHDNLFTKDVVASAEKKAQEIGMKVVGTEMYPGDNKDFSSIILRMKAANPDIVYISSFDGPALPLIQQMRQLRVTAKNVHSVYNTGKMIKAIGKNMEGITGVMQWHPTLTTPYSDLVKIVLEKSDVDWADYLWTVGRLSSYFVMIQAVEKAGVVDREKIRDALATTRFQSPVGDIDFDDHGYALMAGYPTQVQDGKIVAIGPEDQVPGRIQYPTPAWQ